MKPKLRFKEFSDEWCETTLGETTTFKQGIQVDVDKQFSKPFDNSVRFIRIVDYTQNTKDIRYISKPANANYVDEHDVVLVRYGATAGFVGHGIKGVIANNMFTVTPNSNINKDFLYTILKQDKIYNKLNSSNGTSAMPALNFGSVSILKFSYPSIDEQNKLTNLINLLDKKIELQSKKIEDLKLFTKNTISNELNNLQNYNIFKFKDICNIQTGKSNTQDKCDDGIYPFYIRSENIEKSNNYIFDCEAVLTIGDGNIGKVFFYENGKFDCHQRVYVLNNFKNVLGKYVYYYFSSFFYKRAISMSAKNTVDSVRMEMISDMIIKVPQEKEQIKMINLFSCLDKKLGLEQNKLDKLQELKKGLMQNMFV